RYRFNNKDKVAERQRRYRSKNGVEPLLEPLDMTKEEEDVLEAQIALLKQQPTEELIYAKP
ncbi:hypothetical protein, partial [Candidatus Liberibacter brunswickensis]|uniref:hypothetical protein n=1 Tax=Candidatus Liberibacter brunswickensis TaxID=1968796 RepID=UPI0038CBFA18